VETLEINNVKLVTFDVGMGSKTKTHRRHYYLNPHGIVFVIDSSASEKFSEVKADLDTLFKEEILADCPILFVANKQDIEGAKSTEEISEALDLPSIKERKWMMIAATASNGIGLQDGIEWLAEAVSKSSDRAEDTKETSPIYNPIYTIEGSAAAKTPDSDNPNKLETQISEEKQSLYPSNYTGSDKQENSSAWSYITCGLGSRAKEWLYGSRSSENPYESGE
jgi:GTPase SAR1 family protein